MVNQVDVSKAWHDGLVNVGFRQSVDIDVAEKLLEDLGLVAEGGFIQCGFLPMIAILEVDSGKEQEWIDKLILFPEIEWAERVPVRYSMGAGMPKKRLGVK